MFKYPVLLYYYGCKVFSKLWLRLVRRPLATAIARALAVKCGKNLLVNGNCTFRGKVYFGDNCNFNGMTVIGNGEVGQKSEYLDLLAQQPSGKSVKSPQRNFGGSFSSAKFRQSFFHFRSSFVGKGHAQNIFWRNSR